MTLLESIFHTVYNVPELIRIVGPYGLPLVVFAETGLLVGFFLPGDSLLITAGLFAARGDLSLATLLVTLIPAAVLGNATGYAIGRRTGRALYSRPDSMLFRRDHLAMTQAYYERHGGVTIILAQFAPILRTFAPVVAGVAGMGSRRFASFNVVGAVAWITSMTLGGYLLGNLIPGIEKRIDLIVMVVIAVSLLPAATAWLRGREVVSGLTAFGLFAVTAMLVCYALEDRSPWFVLAFAVACALGSVYGFLQGAWPFGAVESIWSVVALRRWRGLTTDPSGRPAPPRRAPPAGTG